MRLGLGLALGVSVRVIVRPLIKCAFARHAAHLSNAQNDQMRLTPWPDRVLGGTVESYP